LFDLIVKPIIVEAGSWIGAGGWVVPGVTVGTHAVLTAGSVASNNLEPRGIYRDNPAVLVKQRVISSIPTSSPNH
jgi:putative colanic acid biosynthesis acetyltransferase WcaF